MLRHNIYNHQYYPDGRSKHVSNTNVSKLIVFTTSSHDNQLKHLLPTNEEEKKNN